MEMIRKHASKLREQVTLRQFTSRFGQDSVLSDESELKCHQKLQMLYDSTREAKHLQRNIIRDVENYISVSSKQMETVKKLSEDCCKYGKEFDNSEFPLAEASLDFGTSHKLMENERENLLKVLGDELFEPLRIMVIGAPLEDARHLTYRYQRLRKDVEAQTAEVIKRRKKCEEVNASTDSAIRLQQAESRLSDLKTTLEALGREATSAMESVEAQQRMVTFQKLLEMVEAERSYHKKVSDILDNLHDQMVLLKQRSGSPASLRISTAIEHPRTPQKDDSESASPSKNTINEYSQSPRVHDPEPPTPSRIARTNEHSQSSKEQLKLDSLGDVRQEPTQFLAEVMHPFQAQADGELSLSIGDRVIVRQVTSDGWAEGGCKGKSGWFPSAYVEQRNKGPKNEPLEAGKSS